MWLNRDRQMRINSSNLTICSLAYSQAQLQGEILKVQTHPFQFKVAWCWFHRNSRSRDISYNVKVYWHFWLLTCSCGGPFHKIYCKLWFILFYRYSIEFSPHQTCCVIYLPSQGHFTCRPPTNFFIAAFRVFDPEISSRMVSRSE